MDTTKKKVLVSGCFDMFHSGHVEFLKEASRYGDVYACIGCDKTLKLLKNRAPMTSESERLFMVKQCRYVKDAFINDFTGDSVDFLRHLKNVRPDFLYVNDDDGGLTESKVKLCEEYNVKIITGSRFKDSNNKNKSSTSIFKSNKVPYRIDLAGGWLDQPYVNRIYPGRVVNVAINPDERIKTCSGVASSTRSVAINLFKDGFPKYNNEEAAREIFCYENDPLKQDYLTGSQDAIGIIYPGIKSMFYKENSTWPVNIDSIIDNSIVEFIERHIRIINVENTNKINSFPVNLNKTNVKSLSQIADIAWNSINNMDIRTLGCMMSKTCYYQDKMGLTIVSNQVREAIKDIADDVYGFKLAGSGGGTLIIVTDKEIKNSFSIKISI